jgi:S-adenosylmethionine:tRNA ribosyltransferase-isomerase
MAIPIVNTSDFDYNLPQEKIAQYPLEERDASKLLVVTNEDFEESTYRNIANYIPAQSIMVFNNTKVIPARLIYVKPTSSLIEIFCLEPIRQTPLEALQHYSKSCWTCMIGGLKKWKIHEPLIWNFNDDKQLEAHFIQSNEHGFEIEFTWNDASLCFGEVINILGQMPIPPYLLRKADASDNLRYQTTYASQAGSVAAPTAGLHFTKTIFDSLHAKEILCQYSTLHVGAGTFKPVTAQFASEHEMHAEWVDVSKNFLQSLICEKSICVVGTTSLRTMESIYWYGVLSKLQGNLFDTNYTLPQYVAYENESFIQKNEILSWIIEQMSRQNLNHICFKTQIMILPSYQFKMANRIITNFHQPKSTLLMLISAATKGNWKTMYQYALENNFRFLSYGDGCLIEL